MGFDINSIKNSEFKSIVAKYDTNGDNNLSDVECSKLVFDFSNYVTEDNSEKMRDEFKKVVIKTAGGNTPELIAQHMDRADGADEKIYADTWNSYVKLYSGKQIKNVINMSSAVHSLEKYGVGTEQFKNEDEEQDLSFWEKYGKNILNYGAIIGGVCVSAFLTKKELNYLRTIKNQKLLQKQ